VALPHLADSVRRSPKNPVFQYHLGMAYLKTGDADNARASLERALSLQPDFDGSANAREALASITRGRS
jgi:Flp pilus assembly protein TadD